MSEEVLVVPRAQLFARPEMEIQGYAGGSPERYLEAVDAHGRFEPRSEVESDPSLKQIIPYAVVSFGERVFVVQRSGRGGESRLHCKLSLGIGGHVNPPDAREPQGCGDELPLREAVRRAFQRELEEELVVETRYEFGPVGVLNDESNAVGTVHFGIVYVVRLEAPRVRVREDELLKGDFQPLGALAERREAMETWSRILLDAHHARAPDRSTVSEVLL